MYRFAPPNCFFFVFCVYAAAQRTERRTDGRLFLCSGGREKWAFPLALTRTGRGDFVCRACHSHRQMKFCPSDVFLARLIFRPYTRCWRDTPRRLLNASCFGTLIPLCTKRSRRPTLSMASLPNQFWHKPPSHGGIEMGSCPLELCYSLGNFLFPFWPETNANWRLSEYHKDCFLIYREPQLCALFSKSILIPWSWQKNWGLHEKFTTYT